MVIGIAFNALALNKVFKINAPWSWWVVLPLATWVVYLLDHLVDIRRNPITKVGSAHHYIRQHQPFVYGLIGLLITGMGYIVWIDFYRPLFICGAVMVVFALLHLWLAKINPKRRSFFNNKEFGVAFVYATSLFIYPLYVLFGSGLFDVLCYYYLLLLLLAYQNLLLCSLIEYQDDVRLKNTSLIRAVGKPTGKFIFIGVSLGAFSFLALLLFRVSVFPHLLTGLYFLILAGNMLIYLWNEQLQQEVLYRKLADLLFWLPGLCLIF